MSQKRKAGELGLCKGASSSEGGGSEDPASKFNRQSLLSVFESTGLFTSKAALGTHHIILHMDERRSGPKPPFVFRSFGGEWLPVASLTLSKRLNDSYAVLKLVIARPTLEYVQPFKSYEEAVSVCEGLWRHGRCKDCGVLRATDQHECATDVLIEESTETPTCAICQEPCKQTFCFECGHMFHATCCGELIRQSRVAGSVPICPVCRSQVRQGPDVAQQGQQSPVMQQMRQGTELLFTLPAEHIFTMLG